MPVTSCIALLAVGTRGDVQPLLALAIELRNLPVSVTLITHRAHEAWLQEPAHAAQLLLRFISSPPTDAAAVDTAVREGQQRDELIAACEAALGRTVQRPSGPAVCAEACSTRALILFNVFALEGFHIAEALGVPCLAASPCLVPYAMPAAFERRFRQANPSLYQALKAADEHRQQPVAGANSSAANIGSTGIAGSVGWAEVRHWLWPLFTERWGAWRHHRLGLPAVPYSDCPPGVPLPPAPALLYGEGPCSGSCCHLRPSVCWSDTMMLACLAPRLLSGVSESVVPRPGFWPSTVHMCGYWASMHCFPASQQQLPPIMRLLGEEQHKPMAVDFGSTGHMFLPQPQLLVAVLRAVAQQLRRRLLLLTGGWQPLLEACSCQPSEPAWVLALERPVVHDVLLPHCAALLHHGGAGTVAAALRCGVPQLVCPLHFDQQQWAERVVWLDCGAQLSPAALLQAGGSGGDAMSTAAELGDAGPRGSKEQQEQAVEAAGQAVAAALAGLLQDATVRQQCAAMKQQLAGEDGLAAAVQLVRQHLEQSVAAGGGAMVGTGGAAAMHAAAAGSARQPEPQASVPPHEVLVLDGLRVRCISAAEALFIHREVFLDDCYRLGCGITQSGSIVVDAGRTVHSTAAAAQ